MCRGLPLIKALSLAFCLALVWDCTTVVAAEADVPLESVQPEQESDRLDVDSLILDRTFIRFGQGFYNEFTRLRSDENPDARENLAIHERPTARWGTLIWITHNRKMIFKTALSPGHNPA